MGEEKKAILESYTKEHSAEYQSQALIDLAFRMREKISDLSQIETILIETSHHTHYVIGTGSGDPQKMDPKSTRETLDHSIMYIFTVALEDGFWHHEKSYSPERANRLETVSIWHKVTTVEKEKWTKLYHNKDPDKKAFGGRVVITMKNGDVIADELERANAHPAGAMPFGRANYVKKFDMLTEDIISIDERNRFINLVENLKNLTANEVEELNVLAPQGYVEASIKKGIFG
ncbi:MAG: 2-methylcitrate dehydratase [Arcticibacterium sp.]